MTQSLGVALAAAGGWLLWSPWALIVGGALLIVAPEIGEAVERRRVWQLAARQLEGSGRSR